MKRVLFCVGTLIILVLGIIAITNSIVDPAHIYSSTYIDQMVEGARRGLNVEGGTNMDERLYKLKLAELNKGKTYDYIAIGSSRIMTLSEDAFDGRTLLNLGVSGCQIEDMMAFLQICSDNDIKCNNLIILTDPTLFNINYSDTRWKSIEFYYNEFNGIKTNTRINWSRIENLFSPSYFQASVVALPSKIKGENKLIYVDSYINDRFTNRPDGSIYYGKSFRENPQYIVDELASEVEHVMYKNFIFSQNRTKLFEMLVDSVVSKGINVHFLNCPFHPIFYKLVTDMDGMNEAIQYLSDYFQNNNVNMIGSFNPEEVGFTNEDFYDGGHLKKESLDKLIKQYLVE